MISKLCFIDWDDTLLCSSWITRMKELFGNETVDLSSSFSLLEEAVCKLLDTIQNFGYKIYIVTNSETGWVELSAGRYVPLILNKIKEINIPIISARSQYESIHGKADSEKNISSWKKEAFANLLQSIHVGKQSSNTESIYNLCGYIPSDPSNFIFDMVNYSVSETKVELLVIGDSHLDIQAAESASIIPSTKVKLLKCIEHPDIFTLIAQIRHITDTFESLADNVIRNVAAIFNSSNLKTVLLKFDENNQIENEEIVVC